MRAFLKCTDGSYMVLAMIMVRGVYQCSSFAHYLASLAEEEHRGAESISDDGV